MLGVLCGLVLAQAGGPFVLTCSALHAGAVAFVCGVLFACSGWFSLLGTACPLLAACALVNLHRLRQQRGSDKGEEGELRCTEEEGFEKVYLTRDGFRMSGWLLRAAGKDNGQTVMFVHGFPDNHHTFKRQMQAFAAQGYTCFAPMLRGYESNAHGFGMDKWKAISVIDAADDLHAWLQQLDVTSVHLVGHDWGSMAASVMCRRHPGAVRSVALLAVPDPKVIDDGMLKFPKQVLNSWYFVFFQWPLLPELWLLYGGGLQKLHHDCSVWVDQRREALFLSTLQQPGVLSGTIAYYRGVVTVGKLPGTPLQCPALHVAGEKDCVMEEGITRMQAQPDPHTYPLGMKVVTMPDTGHFMHHERPEQVSRLLLEFVEGCAV